MTRPLKTIALDERGAAYVEANLSGVNTLCTALLDVIRSSPGRVFATVPADASVERAHQFDRGGLVPDNLDLARAEPADDGLIMPVTTLRDARARNIIDLMRGRTGLICLVDDYNPRWGEPRAHDFGPTAFGIGEEVYHWVDGGFGIEPLAHLLGSTDTLWHGVAAVCEAEAPGSPPTPEWLTRSAQRVLEVNCTAFDGEGFVFWRHEGV